MLGFQVGIRQSFHWQDTRLHWKLDKTNISVSYQSFWFHRQMHFMWMISCSSLLICMHSSKAEKYVYYNTTVDKLVLCFCRRFQGNSFTGPIPSSFSNLTSLESLWVYIFQIIVISLCLSTRLDSSIMFVYTCVGELVIYTMWAPPLTLLKIWSPYLTCKLTHPSIHSYASPTYFFDEVYY